PPAFSPPNASRFPAHLQAQTAPERKPLLCGLCYVTAMPNIRPYAPKDWPHFLELELQTQIDSLGDSTEEERATLRERLPAILDVKKGFSRNGLRVPGAGMWVLEGDDSAFLGYLWLTERGDARHGTRPLHVTSM